MDADLFFLRVTCYLKYLFFSGSRKGHGIHSPFVFDFVTGVLANKKDPEWLLMVEKVRKKLKGDGRILEVTDLGAGYEGVEIKSVKISDIVRSSAVPKKFGILLSNMAREFGRPLIIEFGTSLGISTMYLACGCSGARVLTMEGSAALAEVAAGNFKEAGLANIEIMTGSFDEKLDEIIEMGIRPGLVFLDGNHRKEPTLNYFSKIAKISDPETVVIIDDINYSAEMHEAWSLIKEHEKVSVTIDIFRMGIVFFRKGTFRQSYLIRY
jgi:predicted O-methyltransferase YrrM